MSCHVGVLGVQIFFGDGSLTFSFKDVLDHKTCLFPRCDTVSNLAILGQTVWEYLELQKFRCAGAMSYKNTVWLTVNSLKTPHFRLAASVSWCWS